MGTPPRLFISYRSKDAEIAVQRLEMTGSEIDPELSKAVLEELDAIGVGAPEHARALLAAARASVQPLRG